VERIVSRAGEPKRLVRIPGADHFFEGHLPAVQKAMEDWLRSTLAAKEL
jgi:alpha/beta superfamily hydrolase